MRDPGYVVAACMRSVPRLFGIKDLFTTINALGGAVALILCIEGDPYLAGLAVLFGYMFGDSIDGWVARKLGTANRFGAEYDTIADHLCQGIAPGAIVYTAYLQADLGLSAAAGHALAGTLACALMITASIRHARNTVRPVDFSGAFVGLPRSAGGQIAIAFVDAQVVTSHPEALWLGIVIIPLLCWASLSYQPFLKARLPRDAPAVKFFVVAFFVTSIAVLALWPRFIFDLILFWFSGYALTSWLALTGDERRAYRAAVASARSQPG